MFLIWFRSSHAFCGSIKIVFRFVFVHDCSCLIWGNVSRRSRLVKHERDSFGVTFQNRTDNRTFSIKLSSIRMFGRSMTKNKLYFYILDVSGRISSSYPYRTVLSVYGRAAAAIYQRTISSGQYWYKYTEMVLVLLLLNQNDNSVFSLWTLNIQLYFDKAVKRYDRGWPRWGTAGWVRPHTS